MDLVALPLTVAAYLLGCLNAGYYLVRWRTGSDIRARGTGTAGARNVGRSLGKRGFLVTFLFDCAKGALAVGVATIADVPAVAVGAAALAVVAGHVWPVQLGFRGGKGLATATGAALALDPLLAVVTAALAGALVLVTRRVTLSGLLGVALVPAIAALLGRDGTRVLSLAALAALVLFAHRGNIRALVAGLAGRAEGPDALSSVAREGPE